MLKRSYKEKDSEALQENNEVLFEKKKLKRRLKTNKV